MSCHMSLAQLRAASVSQGSVQGPQTHELSAPALLEAHSTLPCTRALNNRPHCHRELHLYKPRSPVHLNGPCQGLLLPRAGNCQPEVPDSLHRAVHLGGFREHARRGRPQRPHKGEGKAWGPSRAHKVPGAVTETIVPEETQTRQMDMRCPWLTCHPLVPTPAPGLASTFLMLLPKDCT